MDTHNNARLTPRGREEMVRAVVDRGLSKAEAARQFNTTWKTVDKWIRRFRMDGSDGLRDRSSRPHSSPSQTPLATADAVEILRRDRHTQSHVAAKLGLSTATVSRICMARGLSRLTAIEPKEPRPRYERQAPGELVHLDIKKLGRFWKTGSASPAASLATAAATAPDTSSPTSPSTIIPALPASTSCPTRRRKAPSSACSEPSPTSCPSASASIGS